MFILKTLNHLVTSADNYGTVVNFNYFKHENKHKSLFGGITTIIGLIIVVFFLFFKGVSMIKGDNPTNGSSYESVDPKQLYIPDLKQHVMFFINVAWIYNQSNHETHEDWLNYW